MRTGPRHPRLGAAAFYLTLPLLEQLYARGGTFRPNSRFAENRLGAVRQQLKSGETVYLAGIGVGDAHNSGVALVEVSRNAGPRIICNNEEERFSGTKHSTEYPRKSIQALLATMERMGIRSDRIAAWIGSFDYPVFSAMQIRTVLEEAPSSLGMLRHFFSRDLNMAPLAMGVRAPKILGRQLGLGGQTRVIGMPHHDNHAWFSFSVSPFAQSKRPVMVAVLDGTGDLGSISLYVAMGGNLLKIRCNQSMFDSLGIYYSIISSTQGGWTWLSSEGRYMGAAAFGNSDRSTNPFYEPLREIFSLQPEGRVYLNRSLANWHCSTVHSPYTRELIRILGEPIARERMWNPDAVLNVDDIHHSGITRERLDKAAATQMVLEDALFHIIDYLIRRTGSDRLILTGGVALNALANMRLLERFNEAYYDFTFGRCTRLHLWIPPTPNDSGVTMGAAYLFAHLAGAGIGPSLQHAFYCGLAPRETEIQTALDTAPDIAWMCLGDVSSRERMAAIADLMAFITAEDGVLAVFQGCSETGPRALGHRSIVANPCNPRTRDLLNERVKHREAIRPLAPMMTLEAAKRWFELSDGASDDSYNAYNYMVLTARARPEARLRIPAVIHADGTGRLQIVREHTDPLTHAYLKALGRRIGVEVAVNTSFNVAGPIAHTARQAVETLRRSKGMDAVLLFAEEGPVFAAWKAGASDGRESTGRFRQWVAAWQAKTV